MLGMGASMTTGTPRDQAGSHGREPTRTTGQATSANARTAAAPRSASTSTGPTTSAASVSRHSRAATAASSAASSEVDRRARSSTRAWLSPPLGECRDRHGRARRPEPLPDIEQAARPRSTGPADGDTFRQGQRPRLDRERGQPGVGASPEQQVPSRPGPGPAATGSGTGAPPPRRAAGRRGRAARTVAVASGRGGAGHARWPARAPDPCWRVVARHRPGGTHTAARNGGRGRAPGPPAGCRCRWQQSRTSGPLAAVGWSRRPSPRRRRARRRRRWSPCQRGSSGLEQRPRPGEHLVDLRLGDVQAPEPVIRVGVLRASAFDGVPDARLDAARAVRTGTRSEASSDGPGRSAGSVGTARLRRLVGDGHQAPTDAADDDPPARAAGRSRAASVAPPPACPCPSSWRPDPRTSRRRRPSALWRLTRGDGLLLVRRVIGATADREPGRRACPIPCRPRRRCHPAGRIRTRGASRTGGAAAMGAFVSSGAVTTRSSDGFSSPPSADQTSAMDRSAGGGSAMVVSSGNDVVGQRPGQHIRGQDRVAQEAGEQRRQQSVLVLGPLGPAGDEVGQPEPSGWLSMLRREPVRPAHGLPVDLASLRCPRGCRTGTGSRWACSGGPTTPGSAPRTRSRRASRSGPRAGPGCAGTRRRHGSSRAAASRRSERARPAAASAADGATAPARLGNGGHDTRDARLTCELDVFDRPCRAIRLVVHAWRAWSHRHAACGQRPFVSWTPSLVKVHGAVNQRAAASARHASSCPNGHGSLPRHRAAGHFPARLARAHAARVRSEYRRPSRMPTYLSPGVYVEEVEAGSRPIEGVGTAVAAFVGLAARGPTNTPTLVTNWSQFVTAFGDFMEGAYLAHAVYGYFLNGGGAALRRAHRRRRARGHRTRRDRHPEGRQAQRLSHQRARVRARRQPDHGRGRRGDDRRRGHVQADRPRAGQARGGLRQRLHQAWQDQRRDGGQGAVEAHHRSRRSARPAIERAPARGRVTLAGAEGAKPMRLTPGRLRRRLGRPDRLRRPRGGRRGHDARRAGPDEPVPEGHHRRSRASRRCRRR